MEDVDKGEESGSSSDSVEEIVERKKKPVISSKIQFKIAQKSEAKGAKPEPKIEAPKAKIEAPKPKVEPPKPKIEAPRPKPEIPKAKIDAPKPEIPKTSPKAPETAVEEDKDEFLQDLAAPVAIKSAKNALNLRLKVCLYH